MGQCLGKLKRSDLDAYTFKNSSKKRKIPAYLEPSPKRWKFEEAEIYDADYQRQIEQFERKREQRLGDSLKQLEEGDRESELRRQQREFDSEIKIEEERRRMREEDDRKNREMYRNERAPPVHYGVSDWERQQYEQQLDSLKQEMEANKRDHGEKMESLKADARHDEYEYQADMERIEQDFSRRREQLYETAETRRRQMREQFERIERVMRQKVWNEICERNWTDRLNMLRDSNKESKEMERVVMRKNFKKENTLEWIEVLKILKKLMVEESENMRKAYQFSRKDFVLDIQESVERVAEKADSLIWELDFIQRASSENKSRITPLVSGLNAACSNIPTLAELKRKYYDDMRHSSKI